MVSGTKITTDPQSKETLNEGAGIVTSDSLAAESVNSGGDFGSTTGAAVSGQPSKGTTANNQDTSGATILPSAPDAETRQAQENWSETAQLNAGRALGGGNNGVTGGGSSGSASVGALQAELQKKPKGDNLKEGGFDSDGPNASFNNEVGTKKDPARVALQGMQRSNELQAGGAGLQKDVGVSGGGQFDVLKDASA